MPPACICVTRLSSSRFTETSFLFLPARPPGLCLFRTNQYRWILGKNRRRRREAPSLASTDWVAPCAATVAPHGFFPPMQTEQRVSRREPRSRKPGPGGNYPTTAAGEE